MTDGPRVKVMIAHGTPLVRAGLEAALRTQDDLEIVAPASESATSLLEPGALASVGVVVADCDVGFPLAASTCARGCRVLIVTHDESETTIRRAMEVGACGYLLITSPLDMLVRAVRCLIEGGTPLDPMVATRMRDSLMSPKLTARELEVLQLITDGLPDKEIARRIARSVGTVKSHVKSVLTKLNTARRTEAVAVAQRRGLLSGSAQRIPRSPDRLFASPGHRLISLQRQDLPAPTRKRHERPGHTSTWAGDIGVPASACGRGVGTG
jgi:DNA-binding NarL/FixJ family response regulator